MWVICFFSTKKVKFPLPKISPSPWHVKRPVLDIILISLPTIVILLTLYCLLSNDSNKLFEKTKEFVKKKKRNNILQKWRINKSNYYGKHSIFTLVKLRWHMTNLSVNINSQNAGNNNTIIVNKTSPNKNNQGSRFLKKAFHQCGGVL